MLSEAVRDLRGQTRGEVMERGDGGYEAARAAYNAMATGRPVSILRPADLPDIIAAVRWAAESGLAIGVRAAAIASPAIPRRTERSSSTCRGGAERRSTRLRKRRTRSPG